MAWDAEQGFPSKNIPLAALEARLKNRGPCSSKQGPLEASLAPPLGAPPPRNP
ncbi:MAG: hypothetical protein ACI835_001344 [Planctomycetota bacterium]|jgi:hypothetical protein